jgi:hypothetical protein
MKTEWLMMADHAEVINNKAYIMAGGWDVLTINNPLPAQHQCAIVAAFLVPWNETNEVHEIEIEIVDPDGKSQAKIEGRLPGISHGLEQRLHLALNLALGIEKLGVHAVKARASGKETTIRFSVIAGPGMPPSQVDFPALGPT